MPHSKSWTQTLLRELPENPEDLLLPGIPSVRRNYADPAFQQLFFEWLGDAIFHDPHLGLKWAKVAPQLAAKVPEDDGLDGRRAHYDDRVIAHTLLGTAYNATSQHEAAEEEFQTCLKIVETEDVSDRVRLDCLLATFSGVVDDTRCVPGFLWFLETLRPASQRHR